MKDKLNYKKIFFFILMIVGLCLFFTWMIVVKLIDDADAKEDKYWFFEESIQTGKEVELNNAYVYSANEGELKFIYENKSYTIDDGVEQTYSGVADIVVDGDKIVKVRMKSDKESGTLHSYSEDSVCIISEKKNVTTGADGAVEEYSKYVEEIARAKDIPVYKIEDSQIVQADWNHVIVGTSKIQCVMERGQVCAVIIEESLPTDIRVLLKNGSSIFYPNLYIKKASDNSLIDINTKMDKEQLTTMELTDSKGLILCDASGNGKGEAYEGLFRIIKTDKGFVLINELSIETYVKYVLPSEMPKYFHEEALKAQAVCARTFAYAHMSNQSYAQYGANLDDSTAFQVYHSAGRYQETDAAVDATVGEIITCNGGLITCYYFSTSAGSTNDMSVWGSETPEYIAMKASEDTESPFYKWKAYLDITEIKESNYGKLKSIKANKVNDAGYVVDLELIYENQTITITNENDIRRELGLYLQETTLNNGTVRTDLSMIPSAHFEVLEMTDGQIVLAGGGFGHGIGMSQYGANQMAANGFGYKDIIEHYYHNVFVKSI